MKRILSDGSLKKIKSKNKTVNTNKEHWTNESVRIVKSVDCYVPKSITNVMKALNKKFQRLEYSIFCKVDYNSNEHQFEVDEKYYIPKQKVSYASVNYLEDAPEGYNLVIHKHPSGCRSFSGTDDSYINQNFDYSLLWEGGRFVTGQARINTEFGRICLSLDIKEEEDILPIIPMEQLNKIEEQHYGYAYRGGAYGGAYGFNKNSCEDYTDYLHGGFGGFGHNKNNGSFPSTSKHKSVHQSPIPIKSISNGSLLNKEQEDAQNLLEIIKKEELEFVKARQEDLQEYIDDIEVIMHEKNVDFKTAEAIYLEENKDKLNNTLLDFNDPTLGTGINFRQNK